jgi:hypothetical protein
LDTRAARNDLEVAKLSFFQSFEVATIDKVELFVLLPRLASSSLPSLLWHTSLPLSSQLTDVLLF